MISHIGGRAPAGFGLVVRAPNGTLVSASQRPRTVRRPGRRPIILTSSPRGPIRTGRATRARRYAGASASSSPNGLAERAGVRFTVAVPFRTDRIDVALARDAQPHGLRSRPRRCSRAGGEAKVNVILRGRRHVQLTRVPGGSTQVDLARSSLLLHRRQRGRLRGAAARLPARHRRAPAVPVRAELQPAARAEPLAEAGAAVALARPVAARDDGARAHAAEAAAVVNQLYPVPVPPERPIPPA